jgi:hypothetical protein
MVDVGGPCLDLVLHREGVVALVGDRAARPGGSGPLTRLSAWRWNGRTLVQTGEVSLRGSWQALVH